jgi:tetratricopeptide (TPR) repeat protein
VIFLTAISLSSCQTAHHKIEPIIVYTPSAYQIEQLPTAFLALNDQESCQEWSKELILGDAFAKELDLYRALTCYKRARILLPEDSIERRLQIDYNIILCYYLGNKHQEAVNAFEESDLTHINPLFPAFNNLVIILFDAYSKLGQVEKAQSLMETIEKCSPQTAHDLSLYLHLTEGRIDEAQSQITTQSAYNQEIFQNSFETYFRLAKSPSKARMLNAALPGAGYYYVGQSKSAITSFLINALFTAAAYQFFHRGYFAAGFITASLETGWYLGGINGAGIEAEEFNLRLYESMARNSLIKTSCFPVLMFETAF